MHSTLFWHRPDNVKANIPKRYLIYGLITLVSGGLCLSLAAYEFWYLAIYPYEVTPVAPLPNGAVLTHREEGSGTQAFWYIDKYTVDAPIAEVEGYYRSKSDFCSQLPAEVPGIPVDNRTLNCGGNASPFGTYDVEIGRQDESEGGKTLLVIQVWWAVLK